MYISALSFIIFLSAIADLLSVYMIANFLNEFFGFGQIASPIFGQGYTSNLRNVIIDNLLFVSVLAVITSLALRTFVIVFVQKLSAWLGVHFSQLAFRSYFSNCYEDIEALPSAGITSILTNKITSISTGTFFPIFNIISNITTLMVLLIASATVNLELTLGVMISITLVYAIIFFATREYKRVKSRMIAGSIASIAEISENSSRFASQLYLTTALKYFREKLYIADFKMRNAQAMLLILAATPRYVLEATVWVSIFCTLMITGMQKQQDNMATILFVAIALQRLLPAVQQIYTNATTIVSHSASVRDVLNSFGRFPNLRTEAKTSADNAKYRDSIDLRNLYHRKFSENLIHPQPSLSLNGWTLVSGDSGSGKSTLLKLVTGLYRNASYEKHKSDVLISTERAIMSDVHIELQGQDITDGDLVENLSFTNTEILKNQSNFLSEMADVLRIVELEHLLDPSVEGFKSKNLKHLSGGEKQRIAICRALLSKKPVVIFDETTSGLDKDLERRIFMRVKRQYRDLIVVAIAHGTPNHDLFENKLNIEKKS